MTISLKQELREVAKDFSEVEDLSLLLNSKIADLIGRISKLRNKIIDREVNYGYNNT